MGMLSIDILTLQPFAAQSLNGRHCLFGFFALAMGRDQPPHPNNASRLET